MPKANTNISSIELSCSLCPKNPSFSDVSHLLTHISSKSHLSHRFKLQIRAQSEPEAKEKLDTFDYWYHENNLDFLLSGRLAAKEEKKSAKDKKVKISNVAVKNEVKKERGLAQETFITATPVFRAPVPRMHLWPTTTNTTASTPTRDWGQSTMYSTPTARRQLPNFANQQTPLGDTLKAKPTTPLKPDGAEDKRDEKLTDSKLKGVYWPGMDLFDSATPEMKRMRNQRKDSSILDQMMATSAGVEPTEWIYNLDGQLRNSRDIFGPLSTETSPVKMQAPTPKKRRPRKTTAMSDVSVNAPRIRAPRPKKASLTEATLKRPSASMRTRAPLARPLILAPILNPLSSFGQKYVPSTEEDEEFRMTIGDMGKKRAFSIFHDGLEDSPGRTESPLEDHRFDFSNNGLPSYHNNTTSANHMSPTPMVKPAGIRVFGKENGQPERSSQFQVRQTISTSTSHIFPSQMFYDPTLNPLYNHESARQFLYGGHQHGYHEDSKPRAGFPSTFHGDFKPVGTHAAGPSHQGYGAEASNGAGSGMDFGL